MLRPRPQFPSQTTLLTPWQDLLATAASTPWQGWEPRHGSGELQRRVTACYAQLRALPRRMRRALQRQLALPLAGVALLLALGQGPSQAATTWSVCASGCAYTTIQAAIDAATTAAGDMISVRDPVHTEAGITVTKDLSIAGQGADTTVVQAAATPGTASDRVFTIAPGVTVTIQALTLRHGANQQYGGGLRNLGTLTLTNSIVSGNSANFGGGLLNDGTLTLINSTVTGHSSIYGGGLANDGTLTVTNSTISGNSAPNGGGLINFSYGEAQLTNSIVANNPNGGDCDNINNIDNINGSIISKGYNLDSDTSCQLTASTDLPGKDPLLGPLQDNGGPTFTHALLPGSPAINAIPWGTNGCGTTLVSDQRWQARPQAVGGACDIGAYEVEVAGQPLSGWVTGLTPQTVVCTNVTTGHTVTISLQAPAWDCEAAGVGVSSGDQVAMRMQGPVEKGATDVGGAVTGMMPSSGSCTNLTTGQSVKFQHMVGATAASCGVAGLVVHPGDVIQMGAQGGAE